MQHDEKKWGDGMKGILERWEGSKAVIELDSGELLTAAKKMVAKEAREGDVLRYSEQQDCWVVDRIATERRLAEVKKKTEDFWA